MSTDADLEAAFDELVSVTSALEAFPFDDFADRLHNKARECVGKILMLTCLVLTEKSTSWIEVVEAGLKDKTQHQFKITRV
ncbi:hypothetical protein N7530_008529 [Penicillium desertorum]|uniref:Uncharacterized protein n=1 Tax=Penicillium desertorum TaxID=1303715 RepID=A0A9X0BLD0_9EURO|nr:hypothetical protein N7530_008529 [Penicillium desertorum]